MIKAGAEVKIVDNRTKDDLTSVTLAQIIFEEEKKTSKMSLKTLLGLIRQGGEVAQHLVDGDLRGRVDAVRQAAEQRVQSFIAKGQQTGEKARELVSASQEVLSGLQKRIDERLRAAAEGVQHLPEVKRQLDDISRASRRWRRSSRSWGARTGRPESGQLRRAAAPPAGRRAYPASARSGSPRRCAPAPPPPGCAARARRRSGRGSAPRPP